MTGWKACLTFKILTQNKKRMGRSVILLFNPQLETLLVPSYLLTLLITMGTYCVSIKMIPDMRIIVAPVTKL